MSEKTSIEDLMESAGISEENKEAAAILIPKIFGFFAFAQTVAVIAMSAILAFSGYDNIAATACYICTALAIIGTMGGIHRSIDSLNKTSSESIKMNRLYNFGTSAFMWTVLCFILALFS